MSRGGCTRKQEIFQDDYFSEVIVVKYPVSLDLLSLIIVQLREINSSYLHYLMVTSLHHHSHYSNEQNYL